MNAKFATALETANTIPITRPHVCPASTANPATSTSSPTNRWIHPHRVASNVNR